MRLLMSGVTVLLASGFASAAEPELHVVCINAGHDQLRDRTKPGTAAVNVDRPGKEVVLVVGAGNAVEWTVTATPKTKLLKVVAVGAGRPIVHMPNGVALEEQTSEGKKAGVSQYALRGEFDINSERFRPFVRAIKEYAKLPIASFHGAQLSDPKKPFVVNAVQNDERLSADFPTVTPVAQLPKFSFKAVRLVATERLFSTHTFGEFTEAGPKKGTFVKLPKDIMQLTYDASGKRYFGIARHELHLVNIKDGKSTKIVPPMGVKFSWPRALTYDTKRERVLVTGRALYEYVPKGKTNWSVLVSGWEGNYAGLVWQKSTDTLYAVREEPVGNGGLVPTLYELNVGGAVVKKTALGSPMFPGVFGGTDWIRTRVQLIDLGIDLAVLIQHQRRDEDSSKPGKLETFLYVIDTKTGKAKLAWKE